MRKTFGQTPCLDPKTMAVIHQAAHDTIREGLLGQGVTALIQLRQRFLL